VVDWEINHQFQKKLLQKLFVYRRMFFLFLSISCLNTDYFLYHIFGKTLNVFTCSFCAATELFYPATCPFSTKNKIGGRSTAGSFLLKSREKLYPESLTLDR